LRLLPLSGLLDRLALLHEVGGHISARPGLGRAVHLEGKGVGLLADTALRWDEGETVLRPTLAPRGAFGPRIAAGSRQREEPVLAHAGPEARDVAHLEHEVKPVLNDS